MHNVSSQRLPRSRILYQSVELRPIFHRTVRLGRTRSGWTDSLHTKREIPRLIAAKLAKVGSSELAVEQAVELGVLRRDLAVGNLERVRLARVMKKKVLGICDVR